MARDPHRTHWNQQQKLLQAALKRPGEHPETIDLFLSQHAPMHARSVSGTDGWSFEEAVWEGLSESAARRLVVTGDPSSAQSIAWIFWHLARIEDMTMNVLVGGAEEIFNPPQRRDYSGRRRVDSPRLTPLCRILTKYLHICRCFCAFTS